MQSLIVNLPEGWTRTWDPPRAPFRHVDGRESYRHPNRPAIQSFTELHAQAKLKLTKSTVDSQRMHSEIQRFRKMLDMGIPLETVEQSAKLVGINIADIVDESKELEDLDLGASPIPVSFVKKYRKMLKTGVPLKGIQATAFLDGGWSSEQVAMILGDAIDLQQDIHKDHYKQPSCPIATERNATLPVPTYFDKHADGSITVPTSSLLGVLVCKMIQTDQIRGTSTNKGATSTMLQVDSRTLYHSYDALQSIQMARDAFNSTCDGKKMSLEETEQKRQGFVEIAKNIGMVMPREHSEKVNIDGLDELVRHILKTYSTDIALFRSTVQGGWYDFESLSVLYPPGSKVVAKNAGGSGIDMICQVVWNGYNAENGHGISGVSRRQFKVCLRFAVAVSASHATMVEVVELIDSFEGCRPIQSSLKFIPLAAYSIQERNALLSRFRARGNAYNRVGLCGNHLHMGYKNGSFFSKLGGAGLHASLATSFALRTGGRVIVDTVGAYHLGHSLDTGYNPMIMAIKRKCKEYMLLQECLSQQTHVQISNGNDGTNEQNDNGIVLFDQIPFSFLDMVWPFMKGFSLTSRAWGDVLVDGLDDIEWKEDLFDRLILSDNRKTIIKALARRHGSDSQSFQSLMHGKGEGTIFLLYGPPGCGKTMTAEAVAELLHKPLFALSLGSLGTTAKEVEHHLNTVLTLSARWDAVILLEEAHDILEPWSSMFSERNAMVSVILRLVKYFSGILFFTSDRLVDTLDPALQKRMTLVLRYETLGEVARAHVWQHGLLKFGYLKGMDDGDMNVSVLAKQFLNGHEIENILGLAIAMAQEKNKPVTQAMLLQAIEVCGM